MSKSYHVRRQVELRFGAPYPEIVRRHPDLSAQQFADLLGVSFDTVRSWDEDFGIERRRRWEAVVPAA